VRVYFLFPLGVFFENDKKDNFFCYFTHGNSYVSILIKHGLGYILGEFFTNSSGHPACDEPMADIRP
jgi:hypothetical protein